MSAPALNETELAALGATVLTDVPDAIIYADRNGAIRFWNPGAERIFGFTCEEVLGQSLDLIIPERLRGRHWAGFEHMMQTGQSRYAADKLLSVPAQTKNGETLSIQFTVAPVRGSDDALAGIVAVLRDATATFTELKRLRAQASGRT